MRFIGHSFNRRIYHILIILLVGSLTLKYDQYVTVFDHNAIYSKLLFHLLASTIQGDQKPTAWDNQLENNGYYQVLGILELQQNHYLEAMRYFNKSLEETPNDPISGYFLGESMYKMGEYEAALNQWAQIGANIAAERYIIAAQRATSQPDVTYHFLLAEMAVEQLASDSPSIYAQLAEAYSFHNNWSGAINSYHHAIAVESDPYRSSNLLINLGKALQRNNQQQEALAAFKQAVTLAPYNPNTHLQLADQYINMGRYTEATTSLEKALDSDPNNPHILVTIGNFHKAQGHFQAAKVWYQRAIDADPNLGFGEFNLGRLALTEGEPETAIKYLERAIQLGWDSYAVWLELGRAYQEVTNSDKAITAYWHVTQTPDTPPRALVVAWTNTATLYVSLGDLQQASIAWENVLKLDPSNQAALDFLQAHP